MHPHLAPGLFFCGSFSPQCKLPRYFSHRGFPVETSRPLLDFLVLFSCTFSCRFSRLQFPIKIVISPWSSLSRHNFSASRNSSFPPPFSPFRCYRIAISDLTALAFLLLETIIHHSSLSSSRSFFRPHFLTTDFVRLGSSLANLPRRLFGYSLFSSHLAPSPQCRASLFSKLPRVSRRPRRFHLFLASLFPFLLANARPLLPL